MPGCKKYDVSGTVEDSTKDPAEAQQHKGSGHGVFVLVFQGTGARKTKGISDTGDGQERTEKAQEQRENGGEPQGLCNTGTADAFDMESV